MRTLFISAALLLAAPGAYAADPAQCTGWLLQPESKIEFRTAMSNQPIVGHFAKFDGGIILFNPADPAATKADISIDLSSVNSGNGERDEELKKPEWFDVTTTPTARFVSTNVEAIEGGSFVMTGNLTLRGVTLPVTIPFTFSEENGVASVSGDAAIDSTAFGLGQGAWKNDKTIGRSVSITLELTAKKPQC